MSDDTPAVNDESPAEDEHAAADRTYTDALKAVERALPTKLRRPIPIPPPDDLQLPVLNRWWAARQGPPPSGWRDIRRRFVRMIRAMLQVLPWRHQALNEALVDHLNRASAREHVARDATTRSLDGLHDDLGAVLAFQASLIRLLHVPSHALDALRLPKSLAEGLSALGDDMRKRWESVSVQQQRLEATVRHDEQDSAELRLALGLIQRSTAAVEREVERFLGEGASRVAGSTSGPGTASSSAPRGAGSAHPGRAASIESDSAKAQLAGSSVTSYKYVGFEDSFRGAPAEIRERLRTYLPLFTGASDVLDFGCGRGEFLDLLREHGISARGVDINHEMVEACRERGLEVTEGDGLAFLEALPDGALGGLFASQVVEHLQPEDLLQFVGAAFHKLRPGARIAIETINPACWFAFFESYLRDVTHVRAIHPETLKFLVQASGFQQVEIRFEAPVAERDKLEAFPVIDGMNASDPLAAFVETFNANVEKINRLIFTHLDYAAIAVRP